MIGTIGSTVLIDFEPDFCIKNVALIKPQNSITNILDPFNGVTVISGLPERQLQTVEHQQVYTIGNTVVI